MKKIIGAISVFAALIVLMLPAALAKDWPLYNQFTRMHIHENKADNASDDIITKIMFMTLVQNDKELFYALKDQLMLWEDNGVIKKRLNFEKTEIALMTAYLLLEADVRWSDDDLKKDAETIIRNVEKNQLYASSVLGTVLLPASSGFSTDQTFTIRPGALPPFVLERIGLEHKAFQTYARNTYQSAVRGSGDGFIADYMTFGNTGEFILTTKTEGSEDAATFYLWLGITSTADPNRRLLLPLYENMIKATSYDLLSPAVANLFFHTTKGHGSIIFDACMLPVEEGKVKDYLRTRLKNHVFAHTEISAHLLSLFALGHDESRFAFNKDGTLKITEDKY